MTYISAPIRLMRGKSFHRRRGSIKNNFRYCLDCLLIPLRSSNTLSRGLLSKNTFNLFSFFDKDHGNGASIQSFANTVAKEHGFSDICTGQIWLLTQPRFLGYVFNPVSFWIAFLDGKPCAFVAEVNNTFGQRHCYFCAWDDFRPITYDTSMRATKLMHVSPFQKVEGEYSFNFGLTADAVNILISYKNGDDGVLATLAGQRQVASNRSLLKAAIARPAGGLRVLTLIYWQAFKLWRKKAPFMRKPPPPQQLVSDGTDLHEGKP